jgi:hypothetical protein|tara:strand:+ start:760 stop:1014 length:255 start_codon:yes stop_codon:yes gene_type:complete
MTWFIVVVFALSPLDIDGGRDLYIFTNPTYDNYDQCSADITDPMVYPLLVDQLLKDYGKPRKITNVVCVEKKELDSAINGEVSV